MERDLTVTVNEETTYEPSDAPEPAKPIEGDQPLPDLDTDKDSDDDQGDEKPAN